MLFFGKTNYAFLAKKLTSYGKMKSMGKKVNISMSFVNKVIQSITIVVQLYLGSKFGKPNSNRRNRRN